VKITDFGTSTVSDEDSNSPRTSFVGTQDYVSPEVLSGDKKATKACDLWALGCMVYQMLSGISPFRGGTEYLTFENIMGHCRGNQPLTFPAVIDVSTQDLVLQLLKTNDIERLGAGEDRDNNGYKALKTHRFFQNVEWGELVNKQAPFQPDASRFPSDKHMRDGASEDWLMEGDPTPIQSTRQSDLVPADVTSPTGNSKWEQFLVAPERRVFTGLIYKRKVQKRSTAISLRCRDSLYFCSSFRGRSCHSTGSVFEEAAADPDGRAAAAVRGPRHHGVQGRDPLDRRVPRQVPRGTNCAALYVPAGCALFPRLPRLTRAILFYYDLCRKARRSSTLNAR
jgi:serine/threonine protein kinase